MGGNSASSVESAQASRRGNEGEGGEGGTVALTTVGIDNGGKGGEEVGEEESRRLGAGRLREEVAGGRSVSARGCASATDTCGAPPPPSPPKETVSQARKARR